MKKIILKDTKKNPKDKAGKWFYALVFISIITIGTTGHIIRTKNDAITEMAENVEANIPPLSPIVTIEKPKAENISPGETSAPVMVPESLWESDDVLPVSEEAAQTSTASEDIREVSGTPEVIPIQKLAVPVKGDIIKGHSDTELVYSKTMEDWRIHKGVDIRSSIGSPVIASFSGTVAECGADPAHGITVTLDHGNGFMTRYSNLSSTDMVKQGAFVEGGTAIGVVGDTAEFEIAEEAHLHFEVIKDGRSVNPEEYFE